MIAMILTATLLLDVPDPSPGGGLPFAIPSLPTIPTAEVPELELEEIEHSPEYPDRVDEMESMIEEWSAPITGINTALEAFVVEVPDASSGDFTTGFSAFAPYGTAYEYAEFTGEQVGSLAQYARAGQGIVTDLLNTFTGLLVDFMLACAVWLILVKVLVFLIQLIAMLWSIGVNIWNMFFNVAPTGG